MSALRTGTRAWLLSSALFFGCPLLVANAEAAQHRHSSSTTTNFATIRHSAAFHAYPISTRFAFGSGASRSSAMHLSRGLRISYAMRRGGARFVTRFHGISCVPYAREASGIIVAGNAWQWWDNADGLYARGDRPEVGSVLNFRANGRMRLGHVAVVTQVVNRREVVVDHANWPSGGGRGGVSHDVSVVDVSEANNWTAVRVELGHDGEFGSVYPTYGFIYNRPDTGFVTASLTSPAPQAVINRVPADLRPRAERPWHTVEEVAEAPATPPHRIDLRITTFDPLQ